MTADPYALAAQAAEHVARQSGVPQHAAAVVLGSGWTGAAARLGRLVSDFEVADVPGFRRPVADGHEGRLRSYDLEGTPVLAFLGRTHLYEGHGPVAVAHAVRVASAAGCRIVLLTNACGSLRPEWTAGTGVLLSDHLNLSGTTPLVGARFVDLVQAYDRHLREFASASDAGLVEGVYAMMAGPAYQTGAETAMLRSLGADTVGMSTVLETIAARDVGLRVLGLSVVTTREGTGEEIDPQQVVAVASAAASRMGGTLAAVINRWAHS